MVCGVRLCLHRWPYAPWWELHKAKDITRQQKHQQQVKQQQAVQQLREQQFQQLAPAGAESE